MLLIGMFDSPFVRRAAISMKLLDINFEHANWSVGKDFEQIRKYNPLGRVPTLVLDDGEALIESSAILDYLDERAGDARALLPRSGVARRQSLRIMATATGAAEKGVLVVYEKAFRPPEKRHQTWVDRCNAQVHGALHELDKACAQRAAEQWLIGSAMSQADITVSCVFTFLNETMQLNEASAPYPALREHVKRCEALPVFRETHVPFFVPNS
ncbi:MAG TPA: glutathione S-transferase family protein [Steroidobacteraceae bacterium]|nr:glutathione S-transferase family protein [Steroidobacteraceae bacterium]